MQLKRENRGWLNEGKGGQIRNGRGKKKEIWEREKVTNQKGRKGDKKH